MEEAIAAVKFEADFDVLDHGKVVYIDHMGSDQAIVDAARTSYGEGTKKVQEDPGLLRYLLRHKHTSPFEMCEIKLFLKMPIFVARQWIRHRTASLNEYSMRYSNPMDEFYAPDQDVIQAQSKNNKQGREGVVSEETASTFRKLSVHTAQSAMAEYNMFNEQGVARELNRINLPLSTYTQFVWKIDLHNLMHFLKLRLDPHAQYEIRVYAEAISAIVKFLYPITWAAFEEYILGAVTLGKTEQAVLKSLFVGNAGLFAKVRIDEIIERDHPQFSKRERDEFLSKIEKLVGVSYVADHASSSLQTVSVPVGLRGVANAAADTLDAGRSAAGRGHQGLEDQTPSE